MSFRAPTRNLFLEIRSWIDPDFRQEIVQDDISEKRHSELDSESIYTLIHTNGCFESLNDHASIQALRAHSATAFREAQRPCFDTIATQSLSGRLTSPLSPLSLVSPVIECCKAAA